MQNIELISTVTCPFVQRSVIVLHEKGIPFKRTNIDTADKPDWFLALSPRGKVPVLRIDGQVLFESAVICEYIDEVTPGSLHPQDPWQKAFNRAWIEFASEMLFLSFRAIATPDPELMSANVKIITQRLGYLEQNIPAAPYFNGQKFAMIDAAFAPYFLRLSKILAPTLDNEMLAAFPKISAWIDAALARDSVIKSIPENYEQISFARFKKMGSYFLKNIG